MSFKKNRHGNLVYLIQSLVGRETTVELRYECSINGTIAHVDDYMNIEMTGVRCRSTTCGLSQSFSTMFISGNQIRYVHIPKEVNVLDAIQKKLMEKQRRAPQRRKMKVQKEQRLQNERALIRAKILGRGRTLLSSNNQ